MKNQELSLESSHCMSVFIYFHIVLCYALFSWEQQNRYLLHSLWESEPTVANTIFFIHVFCLSNWKPCHYHLPWSHTTASFTFLWDKLHPIFGKMHETSSQFVSCLSRYKSCYLLHILKLDHNNHLISCPPWQFLLLNYHRVFSYKLHSHC